MKVQLKDIAHGRCGDKSDTGMDLFSVGSDLWKGKLHY